MRRIAIIGGGPGGLTLARLLQLQGADVTVYERDLDRYARVQGSALDLHANSGLAALEAGKLIEEFWPLVRHELDRLRLADQGANVLYDFMRGKGTGVHRPEIERGPLREMLLNSLQPGTVQWNKKLESAERQSNGIKLCFSDGKTHEADLAIGADGASSRLRPLVTPIRPEYAGVTLIEGSVPNASVNIPELWAMLGGSAMMALGAEQTLGLATKRDGSALFYAGLKSPEDRAQEKLEQASTAEDRLRWFHEYFPAWSPKWDPLFLHARTLTWRPQRVCPLDQQWEAQSDVTLIGDAAHVMPPYAGEGVNMAMLDALVLSRELGSRDDVREAIKAYESEMFRRMAEIAGMTMSNTERFYAPDAAAQIVAMFQSFARQAAEALPVSDLPN